MCYVAINDNTVQEDGNRKKTTKEEKCLSSQGIGVGDDLLSLSVSNQSVAVSRSVLKVTQTFISMCIKSFAPLLRGAYSFGINKG